MSTFCLGCGNSTADGERFCRVCGRDSHPGASVPAIDPQVAFGLPPETSGKAIFSRSAGSCSCFFLPEKAFNVNRSFWFWASIVCLRFIAER